MAAATRSWPVIVCAYGTICMGGGNGGKRASDSFPGARWHSMKVTKGSGIYPFIHSGKGPPIRLAATDDTTSPIEGTSSDFSTPTLAACSMGWLAFPLPND